jgi:hypothetical protein
VATPIGATSSHGRGEEENAEEKGEVARNSEIRDSGE